MKVGILALQGDFAEHQAAVIKVGAQAVLVRRSQQIADIDGLIIPGGESTAIAKLASESDDAIFDTIKKKIVSGMPVYGTCMGAIFLAGEIEGSSQGKLGLMSIKIRRNGFGSQKSSFQCDVDLAKFAGSGISGKPFPAVFIRAPVIVSYAANVEILAKLDRDTDTTVIMARQNNMFVTTFHPELTGDLRIHRYFLSMIEKSDTIAYKVEK